MKNSRKALIAGLACLLVFGITVPVVAFHMQNQGDSLKKEQVEQKAELRQTGTDVMLDQAVQTVNSRGEESVQPEDVILPVVAPTEETEDNSEEQPVEDGDNGDAVQDTEAPADVVENTEAGTVTASCPYYTDANGDGYCDHCAHNGACGNYVDANGDGICDYCTHNGNGNCGNYADADGDGYCDHCTGNGGSNGTGGGSGRHHGGGHHGGHH